MDALWGRAPGKRYEHIHVRLALAILGQRHSRKPCPKVLVKPSDNASIRRNFVGRISPRRNPTINLGNPKEVRRITPAANPTYMLSP